MSLRLKSHGRPVRLKSRPGCTIEALLVPVPCPAALAAGNAGGCMTETATHAGFTREAVEEISGLKSEPEWMRTRRLEAFDMYEKMPLPARNEEEWRRTDVSRLKLDGYVPFAPNGHGADALPADLR